MSLEKEGYVDGQPVSDWPTFVLVPLNHAARMAVDHARNKYYQMNIKDDDFGLFLGFSEEMAEYTVGRGDADIFLPNYKQKLGISDIHACFCLVHETGAVLLRDCSENGTTYTFPSPAGDGFHVNIDKTAKSVLLARGINTRLAFGPDRLFKFGIQWQSEGMYGFRGALTTELYILGPRQSKVKRYVQGEKIGVGAYASVWSALDVRSGELMAVKKFHSIGGKEDLDSVSREIKNMLQITNSKSIQHGHILEILGSATGGRGSDWAEIFLPLKEGNLQVLVDRSSEAECLALSEVLLRQMLLALDSLEQHDIIHRDVKPENILWDASPGGGPIDHHFWLCDFGLSNDPKLARTMAGAEPFIAPEVFHRKKQTVKVDIWSLFATYIWVRNTGGYRHRCAIFAAPELHSWISKMSKLPEFSRIRRMAQLNPRKRPSPREILAALDREEEETSGDDQDEEEEYVQSAGGDSGREFGEESAGDRPEIPYYEPYTTPPMMAAVPWDPPGFQSGDLPYEPYLAEPWFSLQGGNQSMSASEQTSLTEKGKGVDREDQYGVIPSTNLTATRTEPSDSEEEEERDGRVIASLADGAESAEVSRDDRALHPPTPPPGDVDDKECDTESVAPTTARDQYSSVPSIFTADDDAMTMASSAPSDTFPSPSTLELLLEELSDLLLKHKDLQPLYQDAISKMTGDKFEIHLRGFFRLFGTNLKAEAENSVQIGAANFVRRSARQVAKRIRQEVAVAPKPPDPNVHVGGIARGRQINEWLENVSAPPSRQVNLEVPEALDDESDEEDHDEHVNDNEEQLRLVEIKTFLTASQAFVDLATSIRTWLNPKAERAENVEADTKTTQKDVETSLGHAETSIPPPGMSPVQDGFSAEQAPSEGPTGAEKSGGVPDEPNTKPVTRTEVHLVEEILLPGSRGAQLLDFVKRTLLTGVDGAFELSRSVLLGEPPLQAGKTRIRWQCSCGRNLRGDFDDKHPDAVAELARRLRSLGKSNTAHPTTSVISDNQDTNSSSRNTPPPEDRTSLREPSEYLDPSGSPLTPSSGKGGRSASLGDAESNKTGEPYGPHSGKAYFEVCVNVGKHAIRLAEIEVSSVRNDAEFFDKIWNRYKDTRGSGFRRIFMKPRDIHFVYFGVRNRYQAGIYKKPAEIPLPVEVYSERYHYYECPIDVLPPMPSNVFLHYLSCATGRTWFQEIPSAHGESFFFQRLPKKKGTSIFDELHGQGDARFRSAILYGWGIHIIEGPNHAALSLALGVGIMVSFVVSISVMGIAQTQEQGFGVGQWLIAVFSCLLAALYSKLVED